VERRLAGLCLVLLIAAGCGAPGATQTPTAAHLTASPTAAARPSPTPQPTLAPTPTPVGYAQIARGHIVALTNIGLRVAGTKGEQQAADYIAATLQEFGYEPELRPFTGVDDYGKTVHSANVVALKPGKSSRETIVGAHYDSTSGGPGADDNASGVAVMLEIAELLKDQSTPYTIRFVAFGDEEGGELGSNAFVSQMSQAERANTVGMVNLDSVVAGDIEYVYSDEGARAEMRDWTLAWASRNGLALQTIRNVDLNDPEGGGSSDCWAFQQARIPFVYFEATNWNLGDKDGYTQVDPRYGVKGELRHTRYDTLSYLDTNFPGRVDAHLGLVAAILFALLTEFA
jgi:hypothetical protein